MTDQPPDDLIDEYGWTQLQREVFIDALRTARNLRIAANAVGVSLAMVCRRRDTDPEFRREWVAARDEYVMELASVTKHDALHGYKETRTEYEDGNETRRVETVKIDNQLRIAVLARLAPEEWSEKHRDLTAGKPKRRTIILREDDKVTVTEEEGEPE